MKPADLVRPEILALSAYPVADAEGMVKLDAMENPFRLPPALQDELGKRLGQVAINRYPTRCVADVIAVSAESARRLGRAAATLARAEGLEAHARSAEWRMKDR